LNYILREICQFEHFGAAAKAALYSVNIPVNRGYADSPAVQRDEVAQV